MSRDEFKGYRDTYEGPLCNAEVANDSSEQTSVSRAVYVGGEGDLAVVMKGGQTVTFKGVSAGALLPIRAQKVLGATTATSILFLW